MRAVQQVPPGTGFKARPPRAGAPDPTAFARVQNRDQDRTVHGIVRTARFPNQAAQRLPPLFECITAVTLTGNHTTTHVTYALFTAPGRPHYGRNVYWRTGNCYEPTLEETRD